MNLQDIYAIEGEVEVDNEAYFAAIQRAINSGAAWSFQGSYGRSMMDSIESGLCMLGRSGARDYYGNYIPSRDEVKAGTKGSHGYVAKLMGAEYADRVAAL